MNLQDLIFTVDANNAQPQIVHVQKDKSNQELIALTVQLIPDLTQPDSPGRFFLSSINMQLHNDKSSKEIAVFCTPSDKAEVRGYKVINNVLHIMTGPINMKPRQPKSKVAINIRQDNEKYAVLASSTSVVVHFNETLSDADLSALAGQDEICLARLVV